MGGLIAFEGWDTTLSPIEDAMDLIDVAHSLVPSAQYARLAVAGRTSERKIDLSQVRDAIGNVDASWSITVLDNNNKISNRGLLSSTSFFVIKMHKFMRGFYVFDSNLDNIHETYSEFSDKIGQVLSNRLNGFGYYEKFSDPIDASIYALDLRMSYSNVTMQNILKSRRPEWRKNFSLPINERLPRDFYIYNVFPKSFSSRLLEYPDIDDLVLNKIIHVNNMQYYTAISFRGYVELDAARIKLHKYIF